VWRGWREEDKGMAAATMSGEPSGGISANVNARGRATQSRIVDEITRSVASLAVCFVVFTIIWLG
jgi:hypothetical protein